MRPSDWPVAARVGGSRNLPQTIVHKDDGRRCHLGSRPNHPKPILRRVVRPGQSGGSVVEQQTCTQTQFQ